MRSGTTRTYWFFSLFTMITGVVFWPLYVGNLTLGADANDLLLPILSHIRASLWQGDWPYWNAFQLQGLDATVLPVYWNPIYLVYGAVFPSPAAALNAIYLTLLFIAGWGSYKLCGLFLQNDKTVVLGGLCYPLVGLFVVSGTDLGVVAAAAFLPLLLYGNHRLYRSGKFTTLLQLFLGYLVLSTMTSAGFVLLLGLGLLVQGWVFTADGQRRPRILIHLLATFTVGGFMVWKMLWERAKMHVSVQSLDGQVPGIQQSIQDFASFFLPQLTAMPVKLAGLEGPALFHHYVGIILLVLAGATMIIRPVGRDRKIGILSLALLVLAIAGSVLESTGPLFSGMTGSAFSTMIKIALTLSILMLGLRGFEEIIKGPSKVRYAFLGLSIIGAGLALSIENSTAGPNSGGLSSWFLQLDGWKTAFFCVLTAIALWIRGSTIRWGIVAALILFDLGLTNYLSQDANLWHEYPTSTFASSVMYPEKFHPEIDLNAPVGRYLDRDFATGGIDRNTGTLTRQIVRDGFWPWVPDTSRVSEAELRTQQLRYPIFYFSRDTTGMAIPTITDFEPEIQVHEFSDHRWELSIRHQYEKYLVLNQNYHRGWGAQIDGELIPIVPTLTGMMMVPIKPGSHTIHFEFRPDGVQHVFGFTLILGILGILYLVVKRRFPLPVLGCGIPFLLVYLFQMWKPEPTEIPRQTPPIEKVDYAMTYESRPQNWFLRGHQLTTSQSRSGYRSELLSEGAQYSATLQLDSTDFHDRDELRYRFFIRSDHAANLGVVFKTSDGNTESHNIDYIRSLDSDDWTVVEGQFSLTDLPQPLIRAEWYIWNYEKEVFLIDDIEIKLNP